MARDENDRPYDDGQGRPVNPDLTGDVLSPRWSTDDTDEQPAIQVPGNETYILPPDNSTSSDQYSVQGEYDYGGQAEGAYADSSYDYGDSLSDPLTGDQQQGAYAETGYADGTHTGGTYAEGSYTDSAYTDSGAYATDGTGYATDGTGYADDQDDQRPADRDDPGYLPLDRGYDEPEEEPRRGFLGSGWTGGSGDEDDYRDGEVRRRTRLLLGAAAAVVVLGVGAGWALTSTSSDDPCAGGRCASVGDLSTPSAEEEPEDSDVPIEEATDTATPEPEVSETETPTTPPTTQTRVRPTRTASAEPTPEPQPTRTRTRSAEQERDPEPEPTGRATHQMNEIKEPQASARPEPEQIEEPEPTTDPVTEAPQPEETRRGLLDILFPWR